MKKLFLLLVISACAFAQSSVNGDRHFFGNVSVDGLTNGCLDAGSTDTYVCNPSPALTAYATGTGYRFKANTVNTGPATINLNSLGAKTIVKAAGGITTALIDGDIKAGQWVDLVYDGTNMQMQSTSGNVAAGAGDALVANPLSQFAATTSAQLAGVISNETGTGLLVFGTSPTLITPALGTPSALVLTSATGLPLSTGVTGTLPLTNASTAVKVKTCTIAIGSPGAASPFLADDNDAPAACNNEFGVDWTITSVACLALPASSPTVTPILSAGSGTSILTGALTCGSGVWAAGTLNGTPVLHTFSGTGATCSTTPCSADVNITTAGGAAKYILVKITGTI